MKCLLITSYFPPTIGGSSTVYGTLYKYGKQQVSVLTTKSNSENGQSIPRYASAGVHQVKYIQPPNVHCSNTLQSIWALLRHDLPTQVILLLKTLRLIKQQNIDVVCIGELQTLGWLATILKTITKTKVMLYIHGEELTTKSTSRFLGKNAKHYLKKADSVVCVSSFTKDVLIKQFQVPKEKIKLLTNGIDLENFKLTSSSSVITDRYTNNGQLLIFSAGRLINRKGFDYAIRAMAKVTEKHNNVHLVIAGEGDKLNELKSLVADLKLENIVTLTGRLSHDELTSFYQNCDIFLMPNRELENGDTEGFGLVFLEANAFKKPVIGGNAGGAVDAIINEKTGLLINSQSVNDIATAINRLLEDDELRSTMGESGYQWALQNDAKLKVNEFLSHCESLTTASKNQ